MPTFERQLLAAQTSKMELETKLREKEVLVERLERDRRGNERLMKKKSENLTVIHALCVILWRTRRPPRYPFGTNHQPPTKPSHLRKPKLPLSPIRIHYYKMNNELAQIRVTAEERGATVEELQSQFDELSADQETLMWRVSEEENMSVIRGELHRQVSYLRSLESTNSKLTSELTVFREWHTSVEVLREEKRGLVYLDFWLALHWSVMTSRHQNVKIWHIMTKFKSPTEIR